MSKLACIVIACLLIVSSASSKNADECPPASEQALEWTAGHRALLCSASTDELEQYFASRHREYESGLIDSGHLLDSYEMLWQPFPLERLEAWIARYPNSHAAHLALVEGLQFRANRLRDSYVPWYQWPHRFIVLYLLERRINRYLERSATLSKRPYLSYFYMIRADRLTPPPLWHRDAAVPRPAAKRYLDKAVELDRAAFAARVAYMISMEPRWGGNLPAMQQHLEQCRNVGLTKRQLGRLEAMVLAEEAGLLDSDVHGDTKLRLLVLANERYETFDYLRQIAWLKVKKDRWADALPDLTRALEIVPNDDWALSWHAAALFNMNRHAEAYKEFLILAKQGDAFAQNKVGYYLSMGIGVPQDKREGAKWFAKSAAGGDKHGIANLKQARAEGSI